VDPPSKVKLDQKCNVAFPFAAILPTNTPRGCGNTCWLGINLELVCSSFMRSPKLLELVLEDHLIKPSIKP
jgi:hypothetical protein